MQSSAIIDVAIGMIFVFGITAALASVLTELIARLTGLRGAYLLIGLRELLDADTIVTDLGNAEEDYQKMRSLILGSPAFSPAGPTFDPLSFMHEPSVTGALLGGPILRSQGMTGQISSRSLVITPPRAPGGLPRMPASPAGSTWSQRRSLPSYIPARSFAEAVIDLVVPDTREQATMAAIRRGIDALPDARSAFRPSLQTLAKTAGDDVGQFGTAVEQWYDDHMDRVSGWYKRHVATITLVLGAILVLLLNINAFTIGRTLYAEGAVSTAVSTVASKGTDCSASRTRQQCLADLQAELSAVATAGLPVGWGTARDCRESRAQCNWLDQRGIFSRYGNSGWQFLLAIIGFLIIIIAIVPGARFWFDLLGRLGSFRETGPKPASPASCPPKQQR